MYVQYQNEASGIIHNRLYSVNCVRINCRSKNITVLGHPQVFDESICLCFFKHDSFRFGVRQRIQKMILHQILDVYPHISFIDKGMTIVHKMHMRCDSLNFFLWN